MLVPSSGLLDGERVTDAFVHQFERASASSGDAGQGILGDDHRQAGFFLDQAVEVTQQGAAAGEYDAALGDVRACLLYTSPSPRDDTGSRMPSSA